MKRTPSWTGVVVVDHVDGNKGNNEPENLVPSCHRCNVRRGHSKRAISADELTVEMSAGPTRAVDRICVECGAPFLTRRQRGDSQQHCSRVCAWKAGGRARRVPDTELHIIQRHPDGSAKARVRAVESTCERCAAPFLVEHARLRKGIARFCSPSCCVKVVALGPRPASAGENNHHAALTEADVREMRRLWAAGGISLADLGARFGVSKSGANMVVYRRSWKHVE